MKLRLPSKPRRSLLVGLLCLSVASLAVGWTAATVAASSGSQATPTAAATANNDAMNGTLGLPAMGQVSTQPGVAQGSGAAAAIYPYQMGSSLGVAPEGTILAAGTGTADMKADGSDRATALKKATDAALADAHDQALAVAASVGVQLDGIYSVSIASNTSYTYPTPDCLIVPLQPGLDGGAAGSAGSVPVPSPAICSQLNASTPTAAQLVVTLIVVYKYA